jgi:FKBP-type peptidyl-prolyl cis-trans isomerase
MKRIPLVLMMALISGMLMAQPGAKPAATVKPLKSLQDSAHYALGLAFMNAYKQEVGGKVNTTLVLKAFDDVYGKQKVDSASYALGLRFANFYKQQGVNSINKTLLAKAINDAASAKPTLMNDATATACINNYMMNIYEHKAQGNIDSGKNFLKLNAKRTAVKTTASGLQYEVITEGTGPKPSRNDSVTCHYRGTFLNGQPFDDSYSRGQPITFALTGVIPGWTEGLQLMSTGSKYKLYVPYNLGYGLFDYGPIPGGSVLIFDVELLEVKKGSGSN